MSFSYASKQINTNKISAIKTDNDEYKFEILSDIEPAPIDPVIVT